MSDDSHDIPEALSRKELLRLGARRFKEAGAYTAGLVIESYASRFIPHVQRPPGALPEIDFLLACTRCGECAKACPPHAILTLDNQAGAAAGTPYLDVNTHRPCTACADTPCIPVCPTGALQPIPIAEAVLGLAEIDRDSCLAWQGSKCERCYTVCPLKEDAILRDEDGRVYIDPRSCIGCGLCRWACPTRPRSIKVEPPPRF